MGLFYVFPISESESDRFEILEGLGLCLKTYGPPLIFWGYFAAILTLLGLMALALGDSLGVALRSGDLLNQGITVLVIGLFISLPLLLLGLLFYEKRVQKRGTSLKVTHALFGLSLFSTSYELKAFDSFFVRPFLGSPNMAKKANAPSLRGFQNQGYFKLFALGLEGEEIEIDRHGQKKALVRMGEFLSRY